LFDGGGADGIHLFEKIFVISGLAGVAAGVEEVGADGDGSETESDGIGEVVAVDAGGEGEGEFGAEVGAEFVDEVEGEDVERGAGEVFLFF